MRSRNTPASGRRWRDHLDCLSLVKCFRSEDSDFALPHPRIWRVAIRHATPVAHSSPNNEMTCATVSMNTKAATQVTCALYPEELGDVDTFR